ncbi:hypothetical protein [Rhizobium sp. YK2]|uniref:hypothetical protein n=1 Tax=Rhizobium sp. YK2 TaxID=1860096 RepID=UPI00084C7409|nr:hypothetical protein [Rhizobium sp. YK2]OEC94404.1 hypothetical protein A9Z06_33410 [Rhizobium sp. YK2]
MTEARARGAVAASYGERAAQRVKTLTPELMRIDGRPWKMTTRADRHAVIAEIALLQGRA